MPGGLASGLVLLVLGVFVLLRAVVHDGAGKTLAERILSL